MKKHLSKKTLWQSLLSVIALGIIILLAVGSFGSKHRVHKEDLGGGVIRKTTTYSDGEGTIETLTGKEDKYGVRDGWIKIETKSDFHSSVEETYYEDGYRKGTSTTTHSDGRIETKCWRKGISYPCTKAEQIIAADATAFQVLHGKYPWFTDKLYVFGYDNEHVEAYMDTLETILDEFEDDPLDFDYYYEDAVDSLTYTPYDSIVQLNSLLSIIQGEEYVKKDEFRMATIDRHRSNGKTTYSILETIYPGYLQSLSEFEVSDLDFERFCHVKDSLMDGDDALHGSLDPENTFFVDSVDTRLYRAMFYILNYEDTTSSALKSMKIRAIFNDNNDFRSIYREASSLLSQTVIDSTTQFAASAALYFMLLKFDEGDMIKRSVKEAWLNKRGVVSIPIVLTEFSGSHSATSVSLLGEVLEDGGGAVNSRGIAWADFYNPTTNDNMETSGTGLGTFTIPLNNLVEGTTYYARSYATNSAGTAYGNCLTFTAGEAVGINDHELFVQDFTVYPNPSSGFTTFIFNVESSEDMALTIVNLKGQAVFHHDLGILPHGENRIELDISSLPNGIYNCQLNSNGRTKGAQKMLITH